MASRNGRGVGPPVGDPVADVFVEAAVCFVTAGVFGDGHDRWHLWAIVNKKDVVKKNSTPSKSRRGHGRQ